MSMGMGICTGVDMGIGMGMGMGVGMGVDLGVDMGMGMGMHMCMGMSVVWVWVSVLRWLLCPIECSTQFFGQQISLRTSPSGQLLP